MVSAWGTLTFLVVISSFVSFITCPEAETPGTTSVSATTTSDTISTNKPATTTTGNNGAQQTSAKHCIDHFILRPIKWLIENPLQMFWNSLIRAKDTLASLYGISASKTNETTK